MRSFDALGEKICIQIQTECTCLYAWLPFFDQLKNTLKCPQGSTKSGQYGSLENRQTIKPRTLTPMTPG